MNRKEIVGWKTYGVAAISISIGILALAHGYVADGLKGVIFGLALISLRDGLGKVLSTTEGIGRALADLRAICETLFERTGGLPK
jgi:hypothetical protein